MAEERVRRILSQAACIVEATDARSCGGSGEGDEIGAANSIASRRSSRGINASQWRAQGIDERFRSTIDMVRSSGGNSSDGGHGAAAAAGAAAGPSLGEIESMERHCRHNRLEESSNSSSSNASQESPASASSSQSVIGGAMDPAFGSKLWTDFVESRRQQQQTGPGSVTSSITSTGWGSPQGNWPVADDCIFCKIVHGYAPAFKLYEDDFCVCILDINPLCYGHSLLVPKGHFPALDATPPRVAAAMCSVVPLLSNAIMGATSCDSFNMVVNNGEAAGQVVFHTHFHIVPRFFGDGLWTNESVVRKSLSTFKDPTQLTHAVRSMLRGKQS